MQPQSAGLARCNHDACGTGHQLAAPAVFPCNGLIVHADRRCQYASESYRNDLRLRHAIPGMSRKGNCYDNAAMESFWATLKTKAFGTTPTTRTAAITLIFDYITTF